MSKAFIYIHGKGGNAKEATHYAALLKEYDVIGLNYQSSTPWDAIEEFPILFDRVKEKHDNVSIICNSIGAFFAMYTLAKKNIDTAYFISPIVDMEKLITDMLQWANVTEAELCVKKEIPTSFGETLSWEYLCYVRNHPINWQIPTHILYGDQDNLSSYQTISNFANDRNATLTVMHGGEHWFHTEEQMEFLDRWFMRYV